MKSLFKALTWLVGIVVVLVAAVAIGVLTLVDPNDFKELASSFDEESYRLPTEGLLEYAKLASRLRQ